MNSLASESFRHWAAAWRQCPTNGWRVALVLLSYVGGLVLVIMLANLLLTPALKSTLGPLSSYVRELVQMLILGAAFSLGLWAALRSQRALHGPTLPSLWAAPGVTARTRDALLSGLL